MVVDLFRSLSDAELDAAIKSLAEQIASGHTQLASPHEGSVGYMRARDAERLLERMERSRANRLGLPFDTGRRIRVQHVVVRKDYR